MSNPNCNVSPNSSDISCMSKCPEEESTEETRAAKFEEKRAKQLVDMQDYLNKMAYCVDHEKWHFTHAHLSTIHHPQMLVTSREYRRFNHPKERRERIHRLAKDFITIEELEETFKKRKQLERIKKRAKRYRDRMFLLILRCLEKQCRENVMKNIIEKFSKYLAERCSQKKFVPHILTESLQKLKKGLICNMYLGFGINPHCNKIPPATLQIYNTLSTVLADLILRALFEYQANPTQHVKIIIDDPIERDCLRKRAAQAANKLRMKKLFTMLKCQPKNYKIHYAECKCAECM